MIDQTTGRVAPGRVWSRGLHQLLEAKEGCPPSGEQETIAQITYQRFFPRYLRLCGMSGTLAEAQGELRSVYGLGDRIACRCASPCQRQVSAHARVRHPARTSGRRWSSALRELHAGRPAGADRHRLGGRLRRSSACRLAAACLPAHRAQRAQRPRGGRDRRARGRARHASR